MMTLSQEQANTAWVQFYTVFERLGLSKHYDIDKLKSELLSSPCAITEDMGTAYKGALLMHINMVMALAQRMTKMISGTFQIDEDSLLKVCCIMHLSKRHMYIENENEWEIKNRGLLFKFAKDVEGCLKGGERSALEALNNGIQLTPTEFEAIKALDDEDSTKNPFKSILTTIVKQANEYGMPFVVNISFGNTYGSHDGTSLLSTYFDSVIDANCPTLVFSVEYIILYFPPFDITLLLSLNLSNL